MASSAVLQMLSRIDQAQADPLVDELAEPAARDCPPPTLRCAARPFTSAPGVPSLCARCARPSSPFRGAAIKRDRITAQARPDCLVTGGQSETETEGADQCVITLDALSVVTQDDNRLCTVK